jgi:hypothetical protein
VHGGGVNSGCGHIDILGDRLRSTSLVAAMPRCATGSGIGVFTLQRLHRNEAREKLNYLHNNPVRRGLVSSPGDWPWSSGWYYYLNGLSGLRMDPLD